MKNLLFFAGHSSGERAERFKKMKHLNLMPILLLFALSFGFSSQAWAWALKANCVYLDNYGANWTPWMKIYTGSEDQYYALKQVDGTDYYVREYDYGSYAGFDLYNANNTGQRTSWQAESFESPICFSLSGSSWIKKAVGVKNVTMSNYNTPTIGGDGSEENKYKVLPGTKIEVQMSCEKIAETNHTRQYKIGTSGSWSTTTTATLVNSAIGGTVYSQSGKARAVLSNNNATTSREFESNTIYFLAVEFFVAGNGSGNWLHGENWVSNASENKMVENDGVWSITYNNVPAGTYQFRVTDGSWNDTWETNSQTYNNTKSNVTISKDGDINKQFTTTKVSNITIYFDKTDMWVIATPVYSVTYKGNGNTSGSVPTDATKYEENSLVTVKANSGNLAKTGYDFSGWNTNAEGTGSNYTAGSGQFTITGNTNLFAKWTAKTTTITLDAKGGTDGTAQVTATYDAAMPTITKPTKNGYNFDGYYDADGSTSGSWGTQYYSIEGASARTWDKDVATATLYAKWTETIHTATIAYMCESSSIKESTISSEAGITTTTAITAPEITGYTFSSWTLPTGATTSDQLTSTTININLTADNLTITANYTRNATFDLVVIAGEHVTTVTGGVTGESSVPFTKQISATAFEMGYEFKDWTAAPSENAEFANNTSATTNVTVKNGSVDVTANAKATIYTITYNGLEGGTHTNPATYTIETATFALANASRDNYTFDGWFDAETEGNKVTEIAQGSTGNITLWARWHETTYLISTSMGTGIQSIDPTSQQVGNVTEKQFTATVKPGYTWDKWTLPAGVTGTATNNPISVKATAAGTITANATENMTTVSVGVNDVNMGSVNMNSVSVGVATTATLTATNKPGYKFKMWTLTGGARLHVGSNLNNATIVIEGDGTSASGTATAEFEEDLSTPWRLNIGVNNESGWQQPAFVKKTGESTGKIAYVSVELTGGKTYHFNYVTGESTYKGPETDGASMPANTEWTFNYAQRASFITGVSGTYTFKIDYSETDPKASYETPSTSGIKGDWTGWAHEDGTVVDNVLTYQHTFDATGSQAFKVVFNGVFFGAENSGNNMTRQNCSDWTLTSTDGGHNINLNVDMAGQYTFTYNSSTNKLSVTYPGETKTDVTVYLDGETASTVQVGEATHPTIVAEQYVNGKRFAGWQADEGVTLASTSNRTTQITAVSGAGKSVRATYTTDRMIYFRNTSWGTSQDIYVYLINKSYNVWWNDKDDKQDGPGVVLKKKDGTVLYAQYGKMTRLNNKSDIYYYEASSFDNIDKVVFSQGDYHESSSLYKICAAYRADFSSYLTMYVPEKNPEQHKNETGYYNKGYWMKYDDLNSGYYLRVQSKSTEGSEYEFKASQSGNSYTTTITLEGSQTKEFWINGSNGSTYKNNGTMTSNGSHTGWDFYEGVSNNCKITTTSEGTYTFTLTFGDGILYVSVEYPLSQNDYRVVYTDDSHPCHPSTFIRKGDGNKDTVSFFINTEKNPALKFQYCSKIEGSTVTWTDVASGNINLSGISTTGIYNFYLEQTASAISCKSHELYNGDFYIRTAIAPGGWDAYLGTDGNTLPYIEYGLDDSQPFKFTHAYTNWVEKDKNVKFCIANNYSLCISDTLVGDDIIGTGDNADWLKNGANIRFMWNKNTNALSRAYISGSTNDEEKYLMLINTNKKMYNIPAESETPVQIDELKFTDKNNWVYQADIKAKPGCAVKLTAQYTIGSTAHVQYFMGSEGTAEGSSKIIISGSATDKQYTMRAVYDFKTNRLTAGWVPEKNQEITAPIELGGDMLLVREHQGDANQITFGTDGKVTDIKHIYSVLTIKKDVMLGTADGYNAPATNDDYARTMYWISFPFEVKISEIFGVDGYGQKWIMQKYRGDLRAQKGWFKGDGTETFWEFMDASETLNAYEGYLFLIDANYFNTDGADVWKNSATEANFYFPSASGNIGIINKSSYPQTVLPHECKIDRKFEVTDSEGHKTTVNHKNTDSHWNVIGVPAFQNASGSVVPAQDNTEFKAFYEWNSTTNGYNVRATADSYEFKTMYAYMTQFYGTINWSDVSVVNNPTPAQGGPAPKYAYADEKNYMVELFFNGNGAEDHTYIKLADEASTDFVLNEDMMKIDNAGFPNIYSFAGNYNVAYNETKKDNQTVMLGVSAPKDGNYTFAMPKDFSGTAKLIDLVEGITTDLNVANYSVDLNKGTYNNRFQLVLEVEAKTPTSIEADGQRGREADGKTTKLLRNGNIYLINGGRVYNATGAELQ